jgi:extracellular elastinolytic metalloproteinase
VGYAWASMLWEVYWNLVAKHGFNQNVYAAWNTGGNNLAIQLVIDGMKLQKCSPGFVDGRDAILQADQLLTGGANQCEIWAGFAKRGVGTGASEGSSKKIGDEVPSTSVPPECA